MVPFSSNAVALSMLGSWEILEQGLSMARAKEAKQFREALKQRGLSMWNVVYADTQGNIGYQYNARVPRRDDSVDWSKPVPGADPKTRWGALWELDDLPHAENPRNKILINANSTPQLTPLGDVIRGTWPKYVLSHGPTTRFMGLSRLLDSASSSQPDAGKSRKMATDTEVPRARGVIAAFKAAAGEADSDLREALGVIVRWDGRADTGSKGTGLFYYWLRVKGMPALAVKAEHDRQWNGADAAAALTGLKQAAAEMRKHHPRLDIPWGDMHYFQRGAKKAPVSGFGLFAEGVEFVAVNPNTGAFRDGRILCTVGSSFRMVVDLRPGGIRSWSILPYGNSTNPNSPHYTDQMELFGRGEYKETRQRAVSSTALAR
jgi:acyl-homoserine-lactone acylase